MTVSSLRRASDATPPSGFLDYCLYLNALYDHMKSETQSYSFQKFAADLGFGPTTVMHQIVRGRRPLTLKAADKVIKALALKGVERRFFLALVEYNNTRDAVRREALFERMLDLKGQVLPTDSDKDTLEYFSEWFHPVIRELVGTPGFSADVEHICARIKPRLKPEQVKASLALLERLGLISHDTERNRLVQTQKRISTGHRVRGLALTRFHQEMIDLGREALTRVPGRRRDVSAVTVSVDQETADRIKEMIHALQVQVLDLAERAPGNQIFQMNIQLFPFTEEDEKE